MDVPRETPSVMTKPTSYDSASILRTVPRRGRGGREAPQSQEPLVSRRSRSSHRSLWFPIAAARYAARKGGPRRRRRGTCSKRRLALGSMFEFDFTRDPKLDISWSICLRRMPGSGAGSTAHFPGGSCPFLRASRRPLRQKDEAQRGSE